MKIGRSFRYFSRPIFLIAKIRFLAGYESRFEKRYDKIFNF
ncbi:MAG: hypothetical protein QHH14_12880 [Clostridiales bacterium]|nr:hypothetical protein [Clostridiales bacterium]